MKNLKITYTVKMLKGAFKGQKITLVVDLDELEFNDIAGLLIEKGYLESSVNDEEFVVIDRNF